MTPIPDYSTVVNESRLRAVGPWLRTVSGGLTTAGGTLPVARPAPEDDGALAVMLASEAALAAEWDTPEEDAAWADL